MTTRERMLIFISIWVNNADEMLPKSIQVTHRNIAYEMSMKVNKMLLVSSPPKGGGNKKY